MSTPDITPAQILALVTAAIGLAISQGSISNHTGKLIVGIAAIAIPMLIALGDAIIRHGRAAAHGAIEAARVYGASQKP